MAPTPSPVKASDVIISSLNYNSTISGKTTPASSQFTIKYGSVSKVITSDSKGVWTLKLTKNLAVGTKITLVFKKTKVYYVGALPPTVNAITTKSISISGKTYINGVVTIKVGTKIYTLKASSTGTFKQKIAKTLKKGTKVLVRVKVSGQTSSYKTVIVK